MSNFEQWAIHPVTGEVCLATWMDDHFGRHKYGVHFPDGQVFAEDDVKVLGKNWEPHKPETWSHKFASLRIPVIMSHYCGQWKDGQPVMCSVEWPAGTRVRIVMVSRFGDVGISEQLETTRNYGARVNLIDLCDFGVEA